MNKKPLKQQLKTSEATVETKYTSFKDVINAGNDNGMADAWREFFGGFDKKVAEQLQFIGSAEHELKAGEEVNLKKKEKKILTSENHIDYFRKVKNADVAPEKIKDIQLDKRVEQIRLEIKKLMTTSKQLEVTFKSASVETKVVNAGEYHETFFIFVLTLLKSARMKLQEGASWLSVLKSKKQQRQYHNMAKKHGTTFTLSHERNVATQVG